MIPVQTWLEEKNHYLKKRRETPCTWIDDKDDIVKCDSGLGYVGGQDNLPQSRLQKNNNLIITRRKGNYCVFRDPPPKLLQTRWRERPSKMMRFSRRITPFLMQFTHIYFPFFNCPFILIFSPCSPSPSNGYSNLHNNPVKLWNSVITSRRKKILHISIWQRRSRRAWKAKLIF